MSNVVKISDAAKNRLARKMIELEQLAVDTAGYLSYAYQRSIGLTPNELKRLSFCDWPAEKIDAVEAFYQGEQNGKV